MRVIHIVHGKANPNGENGISRVVYFLNKYQKLQGIKSEIWAFVDGIKSHSTYQRDEFVTIEMFPRLTPLNRNNHPIIKKFKHEKNSIDIVHFHMIWFVDKNILAKSLNKIEIPFIAMTHGTYSIPISSKGIKKICAKFLLELPFLNRAKEIHTLNAEEGELLLRCGIKKPTFIVPNGIETNEVPDTLRDDFFIDNEFNDKIKIGWIGVFREDKNLDLIIKAFGLLKESTRRRCHFIFMGPEHKGYKAELLKLSQQMDCSESFSICDAVYNQEKYDALNSFDLYIMSSSSEGMSMAMLDAMALGVPMILTKGCNMSGYYNHNFFEECECSVESIANAIERLVSREGEWETMGSNAKRLIDKVFSWRLISEQLMGEYKRILGR